MKNSAVAAMMKAQFGVEDVTVEFIASIGSQYSYRCTVPTQDGVIILEINVEVVNTVQILED